METQELEPVSNPTAVKIVDAAARLFMQRGYTAVSINDIIRAAEITKPTLYYYFPDKEELFVQMGLRVLAQMGERLHNRLARSATMVERLVGLAEVVMDPRQGDMRMMRHEMFEHLGPAQRRRLAYAFQARLFAPIEALMADALVHGDLVRYDAPTLAVMFLSLAEALTEFSPRVAHGEWEHPAGASYAMVAISPQTMVDLFLNGVASSPAPVGCR